MDHLKFKYVRKRTLLEQFAGIEVETLNTSEIIQRQCSPQPFQEGEICCKNVTTEELLIREKDSEKKSKGQRES